MHQVKLLNLLTMTSRLSHMDRNAAHSNAYNNFKCIVLNFLDHTTPLNSTAVWYYSNDTECGTIRVVLSVVLFEYTNSCKF